MRRADPLVWLRSYRWGFMIEIVIAEDSPNKLTGSAAGKKISCKWKGTSIGLLSPITLLLLGV